MKCCLAKERRVNFDDSLKPFSAHDTVGHEKRIIYSKGKYGSHPNTELVLPALHNKLVSKIYWRQLPV